MNGLACGLSTSHRFSDIWKPNVVIFLGVHAPWRYSEQWERNWCCSLWSAAYARELMGQNVGNPMYLHGEVLEMTTWWLPNQFWEGTNVYLNWFFEEIKRMFSKLRESFSNRSISCGFISGSTPNNYRELIRCRTKLNIKSRGHDSHTSNTKNCLSYQPQRLMNNNTTQ